MSLEARLKQGLPQLALPIDVNTELDFVRVTAVARQRERRHVLIAAFAGAAAAALLLLVGPRMADIVLGIELPKPLPPAEDNFENERTDNHDIALPEEFDQADIDRHNRLAREREPVTEVPDTGRPALSDRSAPSTFGVGSKPPAQADKPAPSGDEAQQAETPLRTESQEYTGAAVPVGGGTSTCEQNTSGGACVRFETEEGERSVEVSIMDTGGGPVYAAVQIDRDADGFSDGEWTYICTETVRPVAIPTTGVAVVYVEIYRGTCQDGSGDQSNPVRGAVTATFAT